MADGGHDVLVKVQHPIDYPISISQSLIAQFEKTGIGNGVDLNSVLAYTHKGNHICCVFEGRVQPRLLDMHHFYSTLGSGTLLAAPFLRFLVNVFCKAGMPSVREAVFLATWTIEHVISTTPGGVAGPICIGTLERDDEGKLNAREIPDSEIDEHRQAKESAIDALRQWNDDIQSGAEVAESELPPRM